MSALSRPLIGERPSLIDSVRSSPERLRDIARYLTLVALTFAFLLVAGATGLALYGASHSGRIYEGVIVAGQPLGGLTPSEAADVLEQRFQDYAGSPVSFVAEGQTMTFSPTDVGADVDGAATARRAFQVGREGSWWSRSRQWTGAILHHRSVPLIVSVDNRLVRQQISAFAASVVRPPSDAYVDMVSNDQPAIVPEQSGLSIDAATTRARLVQRLESLSEADVVVSTLIALPSVRVADLEPGLVGAAAAVDEPLALRTSEGAWRVRAEQLRTVVSVPGAGGGVVIDRGAVEQLVGDIAEQIDRAAVNAGITVDESGNLSLVPGVASREVDQSVTTDMVVQSLEQGTHTVDITVLRDDPLILDSEVQEGIAEAEALIDDGIRVAWEDGDATLGQSDLLSALTITSRPGEEDPFLFGFDPAILQESLRTIAVDIDDPAENAKFRLANGKVTLVKEAENGRLLDHAESLESVLTALFDGKEEAKLIVHDDKAEYSAKDLSSIAVPDLLADSSTYYGDSSEPRRHNVERAVELEEGWLIAPGEVFSYIEFIGEITKENGFVTGFGIVADQERGGVTTAPVIGGGICQVSTTIFQAAFWAGMPIVERYQHPYWIRTYGEAPRGMQGLDAMVNVEEDWALDLKFENATDDWIAIEISADGERVTTRILGTDPGWDVKVDDVEITDVTPEDDKTYYTESDELLKGKELQVEYAQQGFDAAIHREVRAANGDIIAKDVLESSYAASRNTVLRGTGSGN